MFALLLDENLSPEIARQVTKKRPDIQLMSVHHWHEGIYKGHPYEAILIAATKEGLTLVTYDQKTILPVLVQWGAAGNDRAGVVFIDDHSISNNNFGALVRGLIMLWDASYADEWTNRVDFLHQTSV